MQVTGRRVTSGLKLHIVEDESPGRVFWYTYCGKNILPQDALPLETLDESFCCQVCLNRLKRALNFQLKNS